MISKLTRWVWPGAWALASFAAMVNVVGLLGFGHQAVTYLTISASLLAGSVAAWDAGAAWHFALIIGSFVVGTVMSGYIIQDSTLKLGRRYGVALLLESLLLGMAVPLLQREHQLGIYGVSCACGLQNAMASTYSGALIRTTHLSGMFTDLGIFLGHALRGLRVDWLRLRLCVLIISGFLCGGVASAAFWPVLGYATLYLPCGLTAFTALFYGILTLHKIRRTGTRLSL